MAIFVNNGVTNILGTPGIITDYIGNQPAANTVADGTLFYSKNTLAIYQSVGGTWLLYSGGGGGGTVTGADNGLQLSGSNVELGGVLLFDTSVGGAASSFGLSFEEMKFLYGYSDDIYLGSNTNGADSLTINSSFVHLRSNYSGFKAQYYVTSIGDVGLNNNSVQLIINDDDASILSQFGPDIINQYGFYFNTQYSQIGDWNNHNTNCFISVDYANSIISTSLNNGSTYGTGNYSNYGIYMNVNYGDPYMVFGDYFSDNSHTRMYITEDTYITTAYDVYQKGIVMQFSIDQYRLGDPNGQTNGMCFNVDNGAYNIYTGRNLSHTIGGIVNFGMNYIDNNVDRLFAIGDFDSNYNNTSIIVNDKAQYIELNGNITAALAGGNAGLHLILYVNGTPYKIQLLNY